MEMDAPRASPSLCIVVEKILPLDQAVLADHVARSPLIDEGLGLWAYGLANP